MKTSPLVKLVVQAIEDIKGLDIKVLDVAALTTITDFMVICTGTSNRHVKSIADNVIAKAKEAGHRPLGVEGMDAAEWVLVDLGDVVVHAMQAQTRIFYQLEKLWDVPPPEAEPTPKLPKERKAKAGKAAKGKPKPKAGRGGAARGKSRAKPKGARRR
jgi:ribosome-associated protein